MRNDPYYSCQFCKHYRTTELTICDNKPWCAHNATLVEKEENARQPGSCRFWKTTKSLEDLAYEACAALADLY